MQEAKIPVGARRLILDHIKRRSAFENSISGEMDEFRVFEEVIIKPVFQAYLIPGVYYAPEVSLNILSIGLINQGFEVVTEGDRYRLEYMFKDSTGNMLDLNKLRNMQNSFIEDYFESLNQNRVEKKDEMARVLFVLGLSGEGSGGGVRVEEKAGKNMGSRVGVVEWTGVEGSGGKDAGGKIGLEMNSS
nr:ARID DNA-binding domain-containing protein [Tanacetum cinerariifolium]